MNSKYILLLAAGAFILVIGFAAVELLAEYYQYIFRNWWILIIANIVSGAVVYYWLARRS